MSQQKKSGGLNKHKGKRKTRLKSYYAVQFGITEDNKLRRLRRQIRRHPGDAQARARYKELGGK